MSIYNLGGGLCYYIMPENLFISLTGAMSYTNYKGDIVHGNSDKGWGVTLTLGKEWWVSDNWGLGVALFGHYDKCKVTETSTHTSFNMNNIVAGVMFTATFN